jgi:hypothetical protein
MDRSLELAFGGTRRCGETSLLGSFACWGRLSRLAKRPASHLTLPMFQRLDGHEDRDLPAQSDSSGPAPGRLSDHPSEGDCQHWRRYRARIISIGSNLAQPAVRPLALRCATSPGEDLRLDAVPDFEGRNRRRQVLKGVRKGEGQGKKASL